MIAFLIMAVVVSLSGALAPGPITAAVLAAGTRSRHAGALTALGHAVIEFPLMVLIVAGLGAVFSQPLVRLGIGGVGGLFLALMGIQLMLTARTATATAAAGGARGPFLTGVVLTAANPYFLIWWATVGLALATRAVQFGVLGFVLFGIVHWLCDLVWLEALSLASHKGTQLIGGRLQQIVLFGCGLMLLFFGGVFLFDVASSLP
ncbi:MAG: LysE family transporter [Thermoguttaceae bacterium]